jgi:hypothetical protein
VFSLGRQYPKLSDVDMSFVHDVEDVVLSGLFKSASPGTLTRVVLFGCFGVGSDVTVPSGVVVVGAPRIEQEGMEMFGGGVEDEPMPDYIRQAFEQELAEADAGPGAAFSEAMEIEVAC